jgi:hypothetical protein
MHDKLNAVAVEIMFGRTCVKDFRSKLKHARNNQNRGAKRIEVVSADQSLYPISDLFFVRDIKTILTL